MRHRKAFQIGLTLAALAAAVVGLYFAYYFAVKVPEMRRQVAEVFLKSDLAALDRTDVVPAVLEPADAGPLYQQALDLPLSPGDEERVRQLVAVSRDEAPPVTSAPADLEVLTLLRRAGRRQRAVLPGASVGRLQQRAGLAQPADYQDPLPRLQRLVRALLGSAEVRWQASQVARAAGQRDRADEHAQAAQADFQAVYTIARHFVANGCDIEIRCEGLTLQRMACAGLKRLAAERGLVDQERELSLHVTFIAKRRDRWHFQEALVSGAEPDGLEATITVAFHHEDPAWRREATLGVIRLSRLGLSDSAYAWLIRRRARQALHDLTRDPDPVVQALSCRALGLPVPATRPL